MLNAGKLRHRIIFQDNQWTQDPNSGEPLKDWVDVATVWAAIEPLSARDLIAAQTEDSKVRARIIIRYRDDINDSMRIYHPAKDRYYNIEGLLSDKESGLEYITIPVSEGLKYQ